MKILEHLKNFFKRKKEPTPKEPTPIKQDSVVPKAEKQAEDVRERMARERWLPEPTSHRRIVIRRRTPRRQEHDLSKHFKGKGSKRQLPGYRRSVFEKVKVEEKEDN